MNEILRELGMTLLYTLIGLVAFGVAIFVMAKVSPFCIRKEIEEDQNTALGIIMGAALIGIAIIIAGVITSG